MVTKQNIAVQNMRCGDQNADYIEGKVGGQHIVIIQQVKKVFLY